MLARLRFPGLNARSARRPFRGLAVLLAAVLAFSSPPPSSPVSPEQEAPGLAAPTQQTLIGLAQGDLALPQELRAAGGRQAAPPPEGLSTSDLGAPTDATALVQRASVSARPAPDTSRSRLAAVRVYDSRGPPRAV